MKSKIAIYLAGSIKKGHENSNNSYWTDTDMDLLRESFEKHDVAFLNPAFRTDNLADQRSVFGRDMLQVFSSHAVFVDARDRRGLGVGAEMMWAKLNQIPVVAWAPKNSHYNKEKTSVLDVAVDGFIHPFVLGLSDKVIDTLPEGAEWLEKALSNPSSVKIKSTDDIADAIEYYKSTQFHNDTPMLEAVNGRLEKRMNRPHPQFVIASESLA